MRRYDHYFFDPPLVPSSHDGRANWAKRIRDKIGPIPNLNFNYHLVHRPYISKWKPHRHEYHEFLAWYGSNVANPSEFRGEIVFFLGKELEKHIINQPTLVYLPAGFPHGPMVITRVKEPFFQVAIACKIYTDTT